LPQGQISDRVMEALSLCQIDLLAHRSPLTLSFGEQHRVALASVLAIQPEVLLLDEPFSGLDFMQRQRILCILSELRERFDTTVIIVSHDHLCDPLWADRILTMEQGSIGEGKNNS
jgi:energy-coupling factor transport system ATP-binding protein